MIYRRLFNVPTWQFRSPFGELERMRQQMERLFEDATAPHQRTQAGVFPLTNLTEDKDNYYNQDYIDAKLNDGVLRL